MQRHTTIEIHEYTHKPIYKYTNIQTYTYTDMPIHKYTNVQKMRKRSESYRHVQAYK